MLCWDTTKQEATGKGVVGTPIAFSNAGEEQGRGTLHSHWQIWTKELSQELRDMLFAADKAEQEHARNQFKCLIDQMLSSTYGPDFVVEHQCDEPANDTDHHTEQLNDVINNEMNNDQGPRTRTRKASSLSRLRHHLRTNPTNYVPAAEVFRDDSNLQTFRDARNKVLSREQRDVSCCAKNAGVE